MADHDLRVLQPRQVTDANGNSARATFSPAGFVTASFASGKNGEGDAAVPSVRMEYDLLAFAERGQPVYVRKVACVHHDTDTDVPADRRDDEIVSVEYSDGFGRLLQTRAQAEDVLFGDAVFGGGVLSADQTQPVTATVGRARQPGAPDNVIVSGWQVYDNKGRVVEKYEPFFATGYEFAAPVDAELGKKATIFYDPRGQAIRTVNPDGSEQLTVLGVPVDLADPDVFAPTPWESFAYDANDNAGRTHGPAAEGYRSHWNTPASTEVDALGRPVTVVARNGPDPDTDWFVTRSTYDIQGNLLALTDALGRVAFRYRYDLAERRWRLDSIDAGRRDTILDAARRRRRGPRRQGRGHPRRLRRTAPPHPGVGPRRRRRAAHAAAARRLRRRRRPRPARRRPARRHAPTTCSAPRSPTTTRLASSPSPTSTSRATSSTPRAGSSPTSRSWPPTTGPPPTAGG